MEGVTILNQLEIMKEPGWWLLALLCFSIVLTAGVCTLLTNDYRSDIVGLIASVAAILGLFGMIVLIGGDWTEPTGKYEYEAIIDDTVVFTELYEKYEVVEQRGEIWVLKDKEEE